MRKYLYLILLVVPSLGVPAQAGIFSKRTPANADARVPELLYIVKSEPDESKRAAAAAELREYDGHKYPDMILILVDVLQNDTKPSVRREAAISLGRLRPIHPLAGQALQKASAKDPSLRVRVQAWSSLKLYQINGYNARMAETPGLVPAAPPNDSVHARVAVKASQTPTTAPVPNSLLRTQRTQTVSTKEPPLLEQPGRMVDLQFEPEPAAPIAVKTAPRIAPRVAPAPPATRQHTPAPSTVDQVPLDDGPSLVPQKD